MDEMIFRQLLELASAFKEIGIKPLICGGLGIYIRFYDKQSELPLRITNDIDLMLTKTQLLEQSRRNAIAEIIIDKLKYIAYEGGKHFQFQKGNQYLDILAQPVEGIDTKDFRAVLVKSKLHGHLTPESVFIEEDLKTVSLLHIMPGNEMAKGLEVLVPSLTNQLILKLFAFDDRNEGPRKDEAQAQVHAFDIYTIATLASLNDYREGQQFLSRHNDSGIVQRALSIVGNQFSSVEQPGWLCVLRAANFYPNLNIQRKQEQVDEAKRRLVKWFTWSP
ncbi:MAG TPA: hypothetical protein HPP66_12755 [Planctomycetes bacterium]|nr:hypothetical protein [Planctomycetota bacterium]